MERKRALIFPYFVPYLREIFGLKSEDKP